MMQWCNTWPSYDDSVWCNTWPSYDDSAETVSPVSDESYLFKSINTKKKEKEREEEEEKKEKQTNLKSPPPSGRGLNRGFSLYNHV